MKHWIEKPERERQEMMGIWRSHDIVRRPALALTGKLYRRACARCGLEFTGKSANRKYCDGCSPTVKFRGRDTSL